MLLLLVSARIIPTRMGTSLKIRQTCFARKDHPHAYGDKRGLGLRMVQAWGSSPRVWGQDAITLSTQLTSRIIPTRMGTSLLLLRYAFLMEDHPHAYGDKLYSPW